MTFCLADSLKNRLDTLAQSGALANGYIFAGNTGCFITHGATYLVTQVFGSDALDHNPDFISIQTTPKKITVDTIRTLQDQVKYGPSQHQNAFVLIHDAHLMTTEAANAFLKTLEESPAGLCFILLTAFPHMLLPTIRSRCQLLQFSLVPESTLSAYVNETHPEGYEQLFENCHHNRLLLHQYLEHDIAPPDTLISFQTLKKMTLTEKIKLSESLAKDKPQLKQYLLTWITEIGHECPQYSDACDPILDLFQNLDKNINTRLHLESLFFLL